MSHSHSVNEKPCVNEQPTSSVCSSLWADTHQVLNQPAPLENYNVYSSDVALQHWLKVFSGEWGEKRCLSYGRLAGHELQRAGFQANKYKPEFSTHNRFGQRIDQVDYHPAYHQLMKTAIESGYHQLPWQQPCEGAHVIRAACILKQILVLAVH